MSFDVNWDIDKYKEDHESDDHWLLRRNFMERWKPSYPEERLVCLARVFANIEFMGCRYPSEVMQEVARMSKEVNKNLTYNNGQNVNLPYSFDDGKSLALDSATAGVAWARYSWDEIKGDYVLNTNDSNNFVTLERNSATDGDSSKSFQNNSAGGDSGWLRNPREAMQGSITTSKPVSAVNKSSVDGVSPNQNSVNESAYVRGQYSSEVMQAPVSIAKVLKTTYNSIVCEKTSNQNIAGDGKSTWRRYSKIDTQGSSSLSSAIKQTLSQSFVQEKLPDENVVAESPIWKHRDDVDMRYPSNQTIINYSDGNGNIQGPKQYLRQHLGSSGLENLPQSSGSTTLTQKPIGYNPQNQGSLMPVEEKSPEEDKPVVHEETNTYCTYQDGTNIIDKPGNISTNMDVAQSSQVTFCDGKKKKTCKKPLKLTAAGKRRYHWWILAGKSPEEAMTLSQTPMHHIPEYDYYKEAVGTLQQFRKAKSKATKRIKKMAKKEEFKKLILKNSQSLKNSTTNTAQLAKGNSTNKDTVIEISDDVKSDTILSQDNSNNNVETLSLLLTMNTHKTRFKWWIEQGKSEEEAFNLCQLRMQKIPEYKEIMDRKQREQNLINKQRQQNLINKQREENLINKQRQQNLINKQREENLVIKLRQQNLANKERKSQSHPSSTPTLQGNTNPKFTEPNLPCKHSTQSESIGKLKLRFCETAAGTNKNASQLKVCIKDANKEINQEEYVALQNAIAECINNDEEISIPRCVRKSGCVIVTCADEQSRDWLDKQIPSLVPWEGAQLTIINEDDIPIPLYAWIYIPVVTESGSLLGSEPDGLLDKLHKQNPSVGCDKWKVLNTEIQKDGQLLMVSFDDKSNEVLQSQGHKLHWYSSRPISVKLKSKSKNKSKKLATINPPNNGNAKSAPSFIIKDEGLSNMPQLENRANTSSYHNMTEGTAMPLTASGSVIGNEESLTPIEISRHSRMCWVSSTRGLPSGHSPLLPGYKQTASNLISTAYLPQVEDRADASIANPPGWDSQLATSSAMCYEERHVLSHFTPYPEDRAYKLPVRTVVEQDTDSRLVREHWPNPGQEINFSHPTEDRAGSGWDKDTPRLVQKHRTTTGPATNYTFQEHKAVLAPDYTHQREDSTGSGLPKSSTRLEGMGGSQWGRDRPCYLQEHRATTKQATGSTHQDDIALGAPDYSHRTNDSAGSRWATGLSQVEVRGGSVRGKNTPHFLQEHRSTTRQITERTHQDDIAVQASGNFHRTDNTTGSSQKEDFSWATYNSQQAGDRARERSQKAYNSFHGSNELASNYNQTGFRAIDSCLSNPTLSGSSSKAVPQRRKRKRIRSGKSSNKHSKNA